MPATWNFTLSTGRSEPLHLPSLGWPVEVRTHPRARSMRLRLDQARERLILTIPRAISRRAALQWAERQSDWVRSQLSGLPQAQPLVPGSRIPLEGRDVLLAWDHAHPRKPALADGVLRCGGPVEGFAARIERHLRDEARLRLSEETLRQSAAAGVKVRSVSVGDARSRWGSCSASGAIRYSWRIILAPPHLLRWLVAHEVAHRRHMNHGPAFRALEAELYGDDVRAARQELRSIGPRLQRVGRPA